MTAFMFEIDDQEELNRRDWAFLVRHRSNWTCERCSEIGSNKSTGKGQQKIIAHHKDRNKENNTLINGECLCRSCHAKEHMDVSAVSLAKGGKTMIKTNMNRSFDSRSKASKKSWVTRRAKELNV